MNKKIDVSFSYGDKDFNNITRDIVIRKLDSYKENLINSEKKEDINKNKIGTEQFLGWHKE